MQQTKPLFEVSEVAHPSATASFCESLLGYGDGDSA
jgi:hypothetical protein